MKVRKLKRARVRRMRASLIDARQESKEAQVARGKVQLKISVSDAVPSDRARLMVENFFYKIEVRR